MQDQVIDVTVEEPEYAGFFLRAGALLLDLLITMAAVIPLKGISFFLKAVFQVDFLGKRLIFQYTAVDLLCFLCIACYFFIMTYFNGATVGKMVAGIRVVSVRDSGRNITDILYRETVGRYLSSILGIGYLLAAGDTQNAALHDRLCKTRVVRYKKEETPAAEKEALDEPSVPQS